MLLCQFFFVLEGFPNCGLWGNYSGFEHTIKINKYILQNKKYKYETNTNKILLLLFRYYYYKYYNFIIFVYLHLTINQFHTEQWPYKCVVKFFWNFYLKKWTKTSSEIPNEIWQTCFESNLHFITVHFICFWESAYVILIAILTKDDLDPIAGQIWDINNWLKCLFTVNGLRRSLAWFSIRDDTCSLLTRH